MKVTLAAAQRVGEMVGTLNAKQYESVRLAACVEPAQVLDPTASVRLHITQYEMLRSGC